MLCPTCGAKNNNTDDTVIADAAVPAGTKKPAAYIVWCCHGYRGM